MILEIHLLPCLSVRTEMPNNALWQPCREAGIQQQNLELKKLIVPAGKYEQLPKRIPPYLYHSFSRQFLFHRAEHLNVECKSKTIL